MTTTTLMAQALEHYKALGYTVPAIMSDHDFLTTYFYSWSEGPISHDGVEDWFNRADAETRNKTITEYSACLKQTVGKFYYTKHRVIWWTPVNPKFRHKRDSIRNIFFEFKIIVQDSW